MEKCEIIVKAEELVKSAMKGNDASHDAAHAFRVELAALLHDIGSKEEIGGDLAKSNPYPEFGVVQDADRFVVVLVLLFNAWTPFLHLGSMRKMEQPLPGTGLFTLY